MSPLFLSPLFPRLKNRHRRNRQRRRIPMTRRLVTLAAGRSLQGAGRLAITLFFVSVLNGCASQWRPTIIDRGFLNIPDSKLDSLTYYFVEDHYREMYYLLMIGDDAAIRAGVWLAGNEHGIEVSSVKVDEFSRLIFSSRPTVFWKYYKDLPNDSKERLINYFNEIGPTDWDESDARKIESPSAVPIANAP